MRELGASRRVISFDYRAEYEWQGTPEPRTQKELGTDALALLDALGIDAADLLGYSRGAVAAYAAAVAAPSRVRSLVLLAPVAPFPDTLVVDAPPMPDGPTMPMEVLARAVFSDDYVAAHAAEATAVTALVMKEHAGVVRVPRNREVPFPDRVDIEQPTLIITAGADRMVEATQSARLARAIPHARSVRIEGGSHMVAYERPHEVARIIDAFAEDTGRRR